MTPHYKHKWIQVEIIIRVSQVHSIRKMLFRMLAYPSTHPAATNLRNYGFLKLVAAWLHDFVSGIWIFHSVRLISSDSPQSLHSPAAMFIRASNFKRWSHQIKTKGEECWTNGLLITSQGVQDMAVSTNIYHQPCASTGSRTSHCPDAEGIGFHLFRKNATQRSAKPDFVA